MRRIETRFGRGVANTVFGTAAVATGLGLVAGGSVAASAVVDAVAETQPKVRVVVDDSSFERSNTVRVTLTNVGDTPATQVRVQPLLSTFNGRSMGVVETSLENVRGDCTAAGKVADCGELSPGETVTLEADVAVTQGLRAGSIAVQAAEGAYSLVPADGSDERFG